MKLRCLFISYGCPLTRKVNNLNIYVSLLDDIMDENINDFIDDFMEDV